MKLNKHEFVLDDKKWGDKQQFFSYDKQLAGRGYQYTYSIKNNIIVTGLFWDNDQFAKSIINVLFRNYIL